MHPRTVTAVILAGGAARRLGGRDKGLQLLLGKPLIDWLSRHIAPQVQRVLVSANRNAAEYARYGEVLADERGDFAGPLAGITRAFAELDHDWLLSAPVDCPRPPLDLVARLLGDASAAHAKAAYAHDGLRRQPLFALYRCDLRAAAEQALQRDWGVWQWQDEVGAIAVDFSDCTAAFANLNTPQDFLDGEARWHEL